MATFAVKVKTIKDIEPHTNADALEFAVIDGTKHLKSISDAYLLRKNGTEFN